MKKFNKDPFGNILNSCVDSNYELSKKIVMSL